MQDSVKNAFAFLCQRNPIDLDHSRYVSLLMDFQDAKGDEAIEGLAGFYLYAIRNMGEKSSRAIESTFNHDLSERNDKFCLPRSNGYVQIWRQENEKYDFTTSKL